MAKSSFRIRHGQRDNFLGQEPGPVEVFSSNRNSNVPRHSYNPRVLKGKTPGFHHTVQFSDGKRYGVRANGTFVRLEVTSATV